MGSVGIVLFLLFAVVISSAIAHALPIPVPIPLVQIAVGALIASFADLGVRLHPELFFLLFLPPLLFLDGWRISKEALSQNKWLILLLALGLVFFTLLGGGLFIWWLIPAMPLVVSFALAAVISPTDPIAVSAITERISVPKKLMNILEGEALFNDAAGLVSMNMAVAAAVTGYFSFGSAFNLLLWSSLVGLGIGVIVTFGIAYVTRFWGERFGVEPGTPTLVSLLIPFAAYLLAEALHASGILAAVAAGLSMSYAEGPNALASIRVRRSVVWDTVQSTANGMIFILLGEQLPYIIKSAGLAAQETGYNSQIWLYVAVLVIPIILIGLRFVWILLLMYIPRLKLKVNTQGKNPFYAYMQLSAIMSLAGVRGTLTLAGVLTIPLVLDNGDPFPGRNLSIFLAAGVIVISLLIATVMLPRVLSKMCFSLDDFNGGEDETARVAAAEAAIVAIEKTIQNAAGRQGSEAYTQASLRVIDDYRNRIEQYREDDEHKKYLTSVEEYEQKFRLIGLKAERKTYFTLRKERKISEDAMNKFVREIDLLETRFIK